MKNLNTEDCRKNVKILTLIDNKMCHLLYKFPRIVIHRSFKVDQFLLSIAVRS